MELSLLREHGLNGQIVNEVKVMYTLSKCEYVVKIYDHFEDEDHIYLVLEYAKGVLFEFILGAANGSTQSIWEASRENLR